MSLSGTIQGNRITATIQAAMPAGSANYSITGLSFPDFSVADGTTFAAINGGLPVTVVGPTAPALLNFAISPSGTWAGYVSLSDGTAIFYETNFNDYNAAPVGVLDGYGVYLFVEYSGIALLPQTATVTIRNASDGNVVLDTFTVTFNPEPA